MKIISFIGPWFSLGIHVDFKHKHFDIHFLWWVVVIGNTIDPVHCGYCGAEIAESSELSDLLDQCPKCGMKFGNEVV